MSEPLVNGVPADEATGGLSALPEDLVPALPMDFVLEVSVSKIEGAGEDAYVYELGRSVAVAGVFDGCGGSGARPYGRAGGKTGAYLASRLMAGAVRDWYRAGDDALPAEQALACLKVRTERYLATCKTLTEEGSAIRGSLAKELPTTCAVWLARVGEGPWSEGADELPPADGAEAPHALEAETSDAIYARAIWAGDTRCYLLDTTGLHQVSRDDGEADALVSLRSDAALTNVVSAGGAFELHGKLLHVTGPGLLFCASDGCFGYLSTPMEFEWLLLSALRGSETPRAWEEALAQAFGEVAGDDATLCGACLGFGSFETLRETLAPRADEVYERYVCKLAGLDEAGRRALWEEYSEGYYR